MGLILRPLFSLMEDLEVLNLLNPPGLAVDVIAAALKRLGIFCPAAGDCWRRDDFGGVGS